MHLEFLGDRQEFLLILTALVALAVLAVGFVYPRPYHRRLSALRLVVITLFFVGAVSMTLVYSSAKGPAPLLYVLVDRSVSMDAADGGNVSRAGAAQSSLDAVRAACDSAGIRMQTVFFADEAGVAEPAVGDRRTTRLSPALSYVLEKSAAEAGQTARVIVFSDGATADEPVIDPFVTALASRGIPVDVWPLGAQADVSRQKLFFRAPPPRMATAGESVVIDVDAVSPDDLALVVSDDAGFSSAGEWRKNGNGALLSYIPRVPGLRNVTVRPRNAAGCAPVRFRIKILPKLTFELSGELHWDARFFLVAASQRPGVFVNGRWNAKNTPAASSIPVIFGRPPMNIPAASAVVYWPVSDVAGSDRGIRWLGRETGKFLPASVSDPQRPGGRVPPIPARQKVSLDLGWNVIERYTDGGVFLAERTDTASAPAFLVNAESLWSWWIGPAVASAGTFGGVSPAYERFLDRLIQWARRTTFPDAELIALQEAGQRGVPMEFLALFSSPQAMSPRLRFIPPEGEPEDVYGAGTTSVQYSYVPKKAGSYRAEMEIPGRRPLELGFEVSDVPFDIAYPDPHPELLRQIASRTGGRVLGEQQSGPGVSSFDAAAYTAEFENMALASARDDSRRVMLARTPWFFILLTMIFAVLWTLESKWLR